MTEHAMEVATRAEQKADKADSKIDGHERVCSERYENINTSLKDIKQIQKEQDIKMNKHLDRIYGRAWTAIVSVIILFASIIGITITYIASTAEQRLEVVEHTTPRTYYDRRVAP